MKLSILTVLAVAAVAGSAFAQSDRGRPDGTTSVNDPARYDVLPPPAGAWAEQQASWRRARMSCAADLSTLCGGKSHGLKCIAYHKLTVSRTCRVDMEKAQQGRL